MAHEIEGNRMAYVGETPWHRLGVRLDNPPTTAEAMKAAGMDWNVVERPIYLGNGKFGSEDISPGQISIPTHKAIVRSEDGKVLGVVGNGWTPLQPVDAFGFFDPFLESKQATLETCGVLRGGSRIWVLAKLAGDPIEILPGDEINRYALLADSYDGSLAVRAGFTPIRVVCANTLGGALDNANSRLLKLTHTKRVKSNLDIVQSVMNLANASFEASAEQYRRLAQAKVAPGDLEKYVNLVFPKPAKTKLAQALEAAKAESSGELPGAPESGDDFASLLARPVGAATEREMARLDRVAADEAAEKAEEKQRRYVGKIEELFHNPVGGQVKGAEGTYWQLYNAITAYTSHQRSKSDEATIAALLGDSAGINRRALDVAVQMVNDQARAA